jgi:hypothetical membrane protein
MHSAINASFIVTGLLTVAGAIALRRFWPQRQLTTVALILRVITRLGKILVGSSPENKNVDLHLLGALNIPVGCVAILLLSLSVRQVNRTAASNGTVPAIVGLGGTVPARPCDSPGSSPLRPARS